MYHKKGNNGKSLVLLFLLVIKITIYSPSICIYLFYQCKFTIICVLLSNTIKYDNVKYNDITKVIIHRCNIKQ